MEVRIEEEEEEEEEEEDYEKARNCDCFLVFF